MLEENNLFKIALTELPKIDRMLVITEQLNSAQIPDSY